MSLSVLIVDESYTCRYLLKEQLLAIQPDLEIHQAENGLKAREFLDTLFPDLLITSLNLSRLNGLTLLKKLGHFQKGQDLPRVMIMHPFNRTNIGNALKDIPLCGFISKPPDREEILRLWPWEVLK